MDIPESDPQLNQIHQEINCAAQQVSYFLSIVTTACNPDFILSYLESGVLWSVKVEWARFYYFLPVESLSRVWSSCVRREEESEVRGIECIIGQHSASEQTHPSTCIWYTKSM